MNAYLSMIEFWLVINFGLAGANEPPRVELVPAGIISELRYVRANVRPLLGHGIVFPPVKSRVSQEEVYSFYDDRRRTIYLAEDWTGISIADRSVLVHEMVHHLQNVAGLTYPCAQAREKLAYRAQAKWLAKYGRSLESEFGLDPMTILVRTNCLH